MIPGHDLFGAGIDYETVTIPDFSGRPMPIVKDGDPQLHSPDVKSVLLMNEMRQSHFFTSPRFRHVGNSRVASNRFSGWVRL